MRIREYKTQEKEKMSRFDIVSAQAVAFDLRPVTD